MCCPLFWACLQGAVLASCHVDCTLTASACAPPTIRSIPKQSSKSSRGERERSRERSHRSARPEKEGSRGSKRSRSRSHDRSHGRRREGVPKEDRWKPAGDATGAPNAVAQPAAGLTASEQQPRSDPKSDARLAPSQARGAAVAAPAALLSCHYLFPDVLITIREKYNQQQRRSWDSHVCSVTAGL